MALPVRARRRNLSVWMASGALVLGACTLCIFDRPTSLPPPRIDEPSSSAASTPRISTWAVIRPVAQAYSDPRPLAFRERLEATKPLEAALTRAFLPPASQVILARPMRMAHVAPGRTPQACLAQAVYYEARGEPAEGQAAVAQVVLNRTRSGRHPADVCAAVFEGASRPGCQFSFACDPRLGRRALETGAWRRAQGVAAEVLAGRGPSGLETAVNYHADSVRPRWAAQLQRTAEIGRHIFYASTRAATRALAGWAFTPPAPPTSGA